MNKPFVQTFMEFCTGVLYRKLLREHEVRKDWRCGSRTLLKDVNEFPLSWPVWAKFVRSGNQIPVGARFSERLQTVTGPHPVSCTVDTGSLSRG